MTPTRHRFSGRPSPGRLIAAADPGGRTAGDVYADAIAGALKAEQRLKKSLEQRGLSVASVSGVLTTILLGLSAGHILDAASAGAGQRVLIIAALACFLAAAVLGVVTNMPRNGPVLEPKALSMLLAALRRFADDPRQGSHPATATWRVSEATVAFILRTREGNLRRGHWLQAAVTAEVAGVTAPSSPPPGISP